MHFAIQTGDFSGRIDHHCAVVIQAGGPALEDRRDHHHVLLSRDLCDGLGGRSRHRLSQVEPGGILALTEVGVPEQFRQANHPCATTCCLLNAGDRSREAFLALGCAGHLDEAHRESCWIFHAGEVTRFRRS